MIYYSVLFSLQDPKTNPYIWMFALLFKTLQTTKTLSDTDSYYVIADKETAIEVAEYVGPSVTKLTFFYIPKPITLLEGCLWRYRLYQLTDLQNQCCIYLDVDLLAVRTFKTNIPEDMILVYPESKNPNQFNYKGSFDTLTLPFGFSSTLFVYKFGPNVESFFETILTLAKTTRYTSELWDQHLFNKALETSKYGILFNEIINPNMHANHDQYYFISYAGEPGNAYVHWKKGLQFFLNYCVS